MAELDYRVVDAFTWEAYSGNPAGVVLDARELNDLQMQRIAREINAAETTFVLPADGTDAAVRFRWFTPGCEVDFCGHATLAAVHALIEDGRFSHLMQEPGIVLPVACRIGTLTVRTEFQGDDRAKTLYWLDVPDTELQRAPVSAEAVLPHLGASPDDLARRLPIVMTRDRDLIIGIAELACLLQLQPDFQKLGDFCRKQRVRGVCVTTPQTLTPTVAFHSRFFAPAFGVNEDPVTGSLHGPLAVHHVRCGTFSLVNGRAS
ncbi:MAG: PhzF family phenazine biosynthesis protein, partial [Phycisphaerae bacterium]